MTANDIWLLWDNDIWLLWDNNIWLLLEKEGTSRYNKWDYVCMLYYGKTTVRQSDKGI